MSGNVTEETQLKAYDICKEFLGRTWASLSRDDFVIKRISGGLSNELYQCSVSEGVKTEDGEPNTVMLRIYGLIIKENPETVVTDSVIFGLLSEKKMGPQLFGVFTGGRVEEYVPSRHLYTRELHDTIISRHCARVMVRFHQLRMPLIKQPRWLFDTITRYLDEALNNLSFEQDDPEDKAKLQKLLSYGLEEEVQTLKCILDQVPSPVVFCHNDLQEGNLLLPDGQDSVNKNDLYIMPIDYEYANYNYRGFDIGNHFCEWCYDYSIEESPYYSAVMENYPDKQQQLNFVRAYIEEHPPAGNYDAAQLEEDMLLEANTYALASHVLWGLWSIVQAQISTINFKYLDYALARFEHYFYQKKNLPRHIRVNGSG